jgi:glycosyltransferase involved in cell wall biosynthesis
MAADPAKPAEAVLPIRVMHVIQNLNYGGMERLLADIVRRVDRERFESHVLCLQYLGRFAEGLAEHAELHLAARQPRYSMIWPGRLAAQIRGLRPDVIHTHSGVWYKASLAARLAKVPRLIHTDHGRPSPDPWLYRMLDGMASRRTNVVAAVSEVLARQLEETVVRGSCRIDVVPNGVDTDLFCPKADTCALRKELGLAPDVPIIGSIGRLEAIKGYEIMIEAFAHLRDRYGDGPQPVLIVAGDGSERERLEQMVTSQGLAQSAHLLGWRDDVHDLHSAFALFTMSSHSEGTSVSLLEAMSAGLCPVVTDVGGNRAVVGEDLSHRLVPPDDPAALANAWLEAINDGERRVADGETARRRVQDRFSIEAMVSTYERLYSGEGDATVPAGESL